MVKNIVGIFDSKLQAKCKKIDYAAAYITTIYASSRYIFPTICQQKSGKMLSYTWFFLILIFSQTCTNYVKQIRQLEFFPNILLFLIESTC